jgi:hypothetical protein
MAVCVEAYLQKSLEVNFFGCMWAASSLPHVILDTVHGPVLH